MFYLITLETKSHDVECVAELDLEEFELLKANIDHGEGYVDTSCHHGNAKSCAFCCLHSVISNIQPTDINIELNRDFVDDILGAIEDDEENDGDTFVHRRDLFAYDSCS